MVLPAPSVPWRSATVQAVLASSLVVVTGVPLIAPALPVVREAFGLTDASAGLLLTAYTFPSILLSPLYGMAADTLGRRRVLIPAMVGFALAGSAAAAAPSFPVLVALRFLQGAFAAGVFTVTLAVVGDAFVGPQRGAVLGVNAAFLGIAAAVAPLVGGALVEGGWNVPFLGYLLGFPVAAFIALRLPEPAGDRSAPGLAYLRGAVRALPTATALALYGAAMLQAVAFVGVLFTALPFLLEGTFSLSPLLVGGVLTLATLLSAAASASLGRLSVRASTKTLVAGSFVAMGASLLVAFLLPTVVGVTLAAMGFGLAIGVAFPAIDAAVSDLAPDRYRAGALSLRSSLGALGATVGPVLFAGLAPSVGYIALLAGGGIVLGVAGVVGLLAQ